ncbi:MULTISPECIES: hypothetical protein [unclassified Variovorax]|uniref:hypothetical protein n=1 Tax=unclassified Variovorax TaxID=663243 RepID=UPI003F450743
MQIGKLNGREIVVKYMRSIAILLCFLWCEGSLAGTLYYFSSGELIAFEEAGRIGGSYLNVARADGKSLECKFIFKTIDKSKKYEKRKIFAQEKNRYSRAEANGYLYREGDDWRIRIEFPSAGCRLFPWRLFSLNEKIAGRFSVEEKKTVLGIYVLKKDANYYDEDGGKSEVNGSRRDLLRKGDLVAIIKRKADFSYIDRYFGYGTGAYKIKSSGWIKSSDVGNAISH